MEPTPLCKLAIKYKTDKCPFLTSGDWRTHGYTPYYHELLKDKNIKRVLEIGIAGGASLRMWRDYLPNADIFGFDIDRKLLIQEDRIKTFYADQSSEQSLIDAVIETLTPFMFDLIIEDGSHESDDQVLTANTLIEFLSPNGIYI